MRINVSKHGGLVRIASLSKATLDQPRVADHRRMKTGADKRKSEQQQNPIREKRFKFGNGFEIGWISVKENE